MKKLVLILVLLFGFVSLTNANQVKNLLSNGPGEEDHCWEIANAIEAEHCGYVGCDYDWWAYAFEFCESTLK